MPPHLLALLLVTGTCPVDPADFSPAEGAGAGRALPELPPRYLGPLGADGRPPRRPLRLHRHAGLGRTARRRRRRLLGGAEAQLLAPPPRHLGAAPPGRRRLARAQRRLPPGGLQLRPRAGRPSHPLEALRHRRRDGRGWRHEKGNGFGGRFSRGVDCSDFTSFVFNWGFGARFTSAVARQAGQDADDGDPAWRRSGSRRRRSSAARTDGAARTPGARNGTPKATTRGPTGAPSLPASTAAPRRGARRPPGRPPAIRPTRTGSG